MELGSFYLTLPSNASKEMFPGNQISNFTTKLAKPIDLKGDWEVALTEIQYPHTWDTFENEDVRFTIVRKKESAHDLTFPPGHYDNIRDVVDAINKSISNITEYNDLRLTYDARQRKVVFRNIQEYGILVRDKLARVLGLTPNVHHVGSMDKAFTDVHGGFYTLFVYCDIIEHQRVGDSYVQLLRCVENTGKNNSMINIIYTKPDYITVSKQHFDTITIEVKDDQDKNVRFKVGKLIAKLHFRQRKNTAY